MPDFHSPLKEMRMRRRLLVDPPQTSHTMASFGMTRKKPDLTPKPHQGWDLAAPVGTEIFAIADGVITRVVHQDNGGYGRSVTLAFQGEGKGLVSVAMFAFYAHLSVVLVGVNAVVKRGDVLGRTGVSGNAGGTPPHLHFEIRTASHVGGGLSDRVDPGEVLGYDAYTCW